MFVLWEAASDCQIMPQFTCVKFMHLHDMLWDVDGIYVHWLSVLVITLALETDGYFIACYDAIYSSLF